MYTTIEHKIGTITYYVISAQSEKATETLDKKVEKLIKKDIIDREGELCYSQTKLLPFTAD